MKKETYVSSHTCDQTGRRYTGDGPTDYVGHSLKEAIRVADARTAEGQCGVVKRASDGKALMPDGSWG